MGRLTTLAAEADGMDDDELLTACEDAYRVWQRVPRWRLMKRVLRENEWLTLVAELQLREQRKARARLAAEPQ